MYKQLYQYLLLNKELPVPGVGTFLLERRPAQVDFPNKQILAPVYHILLRKEDVTPPNKFFTALAGLLHLPTRDTVKQFNDFSYDLKKQLAEGAEITWNGIGIISKGLGGDIKLQPSGEQSPEGSVAAQKIIRDKADHMVRVGEEEKTSAEMTEWLSQEQETKSYWWVSALILGMLSIIFLGWYFSENGLDVAATANVSTLVPSEGDAVYRLLTP
ncbi:MAG TPA: hypothetical protein VFV31_01335 [Chitinophagaceae bacterium]|nr:hypothetical protein [Chitinophagaceae bacterium]